MAKLELQKLITRAKALFDCLNIAIVHRFGQVSVGETSVCVAVGSVHRADGFNAAVYIMDEIKARLPIWKKEHLSDGSAWKQNPEFATTVSKLDNFDCA